jgi:hypothetical protein
LPGWLCLAPGLVDEVAITAMIPYVGSKRFDGRVLQVGGALQIVETSCTANC